MSEPKYPLHGYLYHPDGTIGHSGLLSNRRSLWGFVGVYGKFALQNGLELRILSSDEEVCYFHITDGAVVEGQGREWQECRAALHHHSREYEMSLGSGLHVALDSRAGSEKFLRNDWVFGVWTHIDIGTTVADSYTASVVLLLPDGKQVLGQAPWQDVLNAIRQLTQYAEEPQRGGQPHAPRPA